MIGTFLTNLHCSHTICRIYKTRLTEVSQCVGLKISKEEVMRTRAKQEAPLTIERSSVEDVNEFVYLGSKISQSCRTEEDITAKTRKTRQAFAILRPVRKSTDISTHTKLRIVNSNIKSVLMYGSKTWRVTISSSKKVQTFLNRCLRQILQLKWLDKVPTKH